MVGGGTVVGVRGRIEVLGDVTMVGGGTVGPDTIVDVGDLVVVFDVTVVVSGLLDVDGDTGVPIVWQWLDLRTISDVTFSQNVW